MASITRLFSFIVLTGFALFASGCVESMAQPKARVDQGVETQFPPYSGPKASVAVAKFDWKVGGSGSTTTVRGVGDRPITVTHEQSGYTSGLRDMLTTVLVQSKR